MASDDKDVPQQLTFGTTFQLSCVDAVAVEKLGMVATVDSGRQTLTLHSGSVKVARVHFQTSSNVQVVKCPSIFFLVVKQTKTKASMQS